MDRNELNDEYVNRAYQLAYFIHGDKATARQIVTSAMNLLEVAAAAQDKRLYYTPTGRTLARKARTKVSLSELHLLQRLIYIESEPYEKNRERTDALLSEEDMITHFIKHLVKITVKRNSFYVALGLSRLLYNYTTAETQEIYNVAVQDPERVKDDYYYRSRKAQLMREMKERFTDFLQCVKGHRGEEKFQAKDSVDSFAELVKDCLRMFTPWATPCLMPAQFDGFNDVLGHLSFQDTDPDEEHRVEINRLHTLLHTECFSRLIKGIGYDSPELKLQIPQFFFAKQNQGGPRPGRRNPMTLHEDELEGIREHLASQSARRRHAAAGLFRVLVDGEERARFDIQETRKVQFEIEEGAELIEVRASDAGGELLLAAHLLEFDADPSQSQPFHTSIILEAGQKVSFSVKPFKNPTGEMDGAQIEVAYKETSMMRAASLSFQQWRSRAAQGISSPKWLDMGAMKPILATLFLALCAAIVFFYFQSTRKTPDQKADIKQPVEQVQPEPSVPKIARNPDQQNQQEPKRQGPQKPRLPENNEKRNQIAGGSRKKRNVQNHPKRDNTEQTVPDNVIAYGPSRGTEPPIIGVSLVEVKRIAIGPYGAETLNPKLRDAIAAALQATNRFNVVQNSNEADAVLKISTKQELTAQPNESPVATIIALLVNVNGYAVWPAQPQSSGERYSGTANEIAARIAASILSEIQKAERRK
jgi:hypothetical protein